MADHIGTNDVGVIEEIRTLLSEDKAISTKSALKLSLRLQVKMYGQMKEQGVAITGHGTRLDALERSSIMMWIGKHPKLATAIITIVIVTSTVLDLRVIIAKVLGIDL